MSRGTGMSRVILVYVFTTSAILGATAQSPSPTSVGTGLIKSTIKSPAKTLETTKKTPETSATLATTTKDTFISPSPQETVVTAIVTTQDIMKEMDRAKADIIEGYTSLKTAKKPEVAKELTENTRVNVEVKDIKDMGVESVNDWTNWNLLTFFVNITFVGSEKFLSPCTHPSDQGDYVAAMRDVANFRPEYTLISFFSCKDMNGEIFMVFKVTHVPVVVHEGEPVKGPFYESRLFIFSAIGAGGGLIIIVLSIICFSVGKGYQDRKAKRWLNTYQRRMAEQDGLSESSSIMMAEKYREMPNDFVQV